MAEIGIFLDRDGTINEEIEFLHAPDQIRLIPKAADAIREFNMLGFKIFILTNQSGIAHGIFNENDLKEIHEKLLSILKKSNAKIDHIYYCPHHPEGKIEKYRKICNCRKPMTGMFEIAAKEYNINLSRSFVIGDKKIDIEAGNNCGAFSILVLTGYGKSELERCRETNTKIDFVAEDLYNAVQFIKNKSMEKV